MFISDVVKRLWDKKYQEYQREYLCADQVEAQELYKYLLESIDDVKNDIYSYKSVDYSITFLPSSGCPHFMGKGCFSGCSMCDYFSNHIISLARMNVLRKKDEKLYAELIRKGYELSRGIAVTPSVVSEVITSYDFLNEEEFPNIAYENMFEKGPLFIGRPLRYEFETRATSVSGKKLEKLIHTFGKRIYIKMGIETGNEWIRNHWLNKNIYDRDIQRAIEIIHEHHLKASANIIIGMPGFTENQTIHNFVSTVIKLSRFGFDTIICSPLVRKEITLQNYIYKNLSNNQILRDKGLVYGEHTSIPWIFTIFEAIYQALLVQPDLATKLTISIVNLPGHYSMMEREYDKRQVQYFIKEIVNFLTSSSRRLDINRMSEIRAQFVETSFYMEYLQLIQLQENAGSLLDTLYTLGVEISKNMWPDKWADIVEMWKVELQSAPESEE